MDMCLVDLWLRNILTLHLYKNIVNFKHSSFLHNNRKVYNTIILHDIVFVFFENRYNNVIRYILVV